MANPVTMFKKASTVLTASATLFAMLRDMPELKKGLNSVIERLRTATNSRSPKVRFDAKLLAIETAADTAANLFDAPSQAQQWRHAAAALRTRSELVWHANEGRRRRSAMHALNTETTELLERINAELMTMAQLTPQAGPELNRPEV